MTRGREAKNSGARGAEKICLWEARMNLFHRSGSVLSAGTKVLTLGDEQRYTDQEQAMHYIANLRPNIVDAAELVGVLADIRQTAEEALTELPAHH
jgi:hypothetical protein